MNTQKHPQNTKNENRPKLHLKRRFKSSRYRHRIPDEKLHLKPSSKHVLMPFTQKMSFWAPMSTPKTVHNGSGSQRFRFKRFRLTDNRFGSRPSWTSFRSTVVFERLGIRCALDSHTLAAAFAEGLSPDALDPADDKRGCDSISGERHETHPRDPLRGERVREHARRS